MYQYQWNVVYFQIHVYAAELFMLKVTCNVQAVFNKRVSLKFSIVSFIHLYLVHSIITHLHFAHNSATRLSFSYRYMALKDINLTWVRYCPP